MFGLEYAILHNTFGTRNNVNKHAPGRDGKCVEEGKGVDIGGRCISKKEKCKYACFWPNN